MKIGTIADVTGPVSGLFTGAEEGIEAFAQFINATSGGICSHQVQVAFKDGGTNCTQNENATSSLISQVFAFVGTFSLYDNCGATVLKAHPTVPDIHVALDPAAAPLSNHFDLEPGALGYANGMFAYYKQKYGSKVQHVGTIAESLPSALAKQAAITHAAESAGWKFVTSINEQPTNGNFVGDFVKMCTQQHIQMFFTVTEDAQNAATMIQNEKQAGCPSSLINVIPIAYDQQFLSSLGGSKSLANGLQGYSEYALFFNPNEAKQIPELGNLQTWFNRVYPGQPLNLYAMYSWAEGRLFQQAMEHAGKAVTQKTVLAALRKIANYTNGGMVAPATPSSKSTGAHCYILWQLENGTFSRVADPPVTAGNQGGYRCDGSYISK
jgi:ABC-type branched-subunit amino acid transport system substrate-binding protein